MYRIRHRCCWRGQNEPVVVRRASNKLPFFFFLLFFADQEHNRPSLRECRARRTSFCSPRLCVSSVPRSSPKVHLATSGPLRPRRRRRWRRRPPRRRRVRSNRPPGLVRNVRAVIVVVRVAAVVVAVPRVSAPPPVSVVVVTFLAGRGDRHAHIARIAVAYGIVALVAAPCHETVSRPACVVSSRRTRRPVVVLLPIVVVLTYRLLSVGRENEQVALKAVQYQRARQPRVICFFFCRGPAHTTASKMCCDFLRSARLLGPTRGTCKFDPLTVPTVAKSLLPYTRPTAHAAFCILFRNSRSVYSCWCFRFRTFWIQPTCLLLWCFPVQFLVRFSSWPSVY